MHTIRLAHEPSDVPGMSWVRLAVDPSGYMSGLFDEARRNHVPTPISLPAAPDLPVNGQPALGWIALLQVRPASDGRGTELWGLTRWLAAAEPHLSSGEPLWAQVRIPDHHIDGRTGVDVGARLQPIELVPAPFPTHLRKSPIANTRHITLEKERPTMHQNPEIQAIVDAFDRFAHHAPANQVRLCALEVVPRAKDLTPHQLMVELVEPARQELINRGKIALELKPRRATHEMSGGRVSASALRPNTAPVEAPAAKPTLDVRHLAGRNPHERKMTHVRLTRPDLASNFEAVHEAASQLDKTHTVLA